MKKIASFAAIALCASTAFADAPAQEPRDGGYWSLGYAKVTTDLKSGGQSFDLQSINLAWGYHFHPNVAAELWGSFNVAPDTDDYTSGLVGEKVEAEFDSFGAFVVGRLGQKVYGIARAGLVNSRFTYSAKGYEDEKEDAFGLGFGIGGGVNVGKAQWELNYLVLPEVDDPIFTAESYETDMLTIGFNYYY